MDSIPIAGNETEVSKDSIMQNCVQEVGFSPDVLKDSKMNSNILENAATSGLKNDETKSASAMLQNLEPKISTKEKENYSNVTSLLKENSSWNVLSTPVEMQFEEFDKIGNIGVISSNEVIDGSLDSTPGTQNELPLIREVLNSIIERVCEISNAADNHCEKDNEMKVHRKKHSSEDFSITIPLIGRSVFQNNDKPLTKRYDLAMEINRRRALYDKQKGYDKSNPNLELWEIQARQIEEDKNRSATSKDYENVKLAIMITRITLKILKQLPKESVNQRRIVRYFTRFLEVDVTPTSLLYVPHFVHIMSFCRGYKGFAKPLRLAADKCYNRCHAMFPVPLGYNFETAYTFQVGKFQPKNIKDFENLPLNYGSISDVNVESSDSESDSESESGEENTVLGFDCISHMFPYNFRI